MCPELTCPGYFLSFMNHSNTFIFSLCMLKVSKTLYYLILPDYLHRTENHTRTIQEYYHAMYYKKKDPLFLLLYFSKIPSKKVNPLAPSLFPCTFQVHSYWDQKLLLYFIFTFTFSFLLRMQVFHVKCNLKCTMKGIRTVATCLNVI